MKCIKRLFMKIFIKVIAALLLLFMPIGILLGVWLATPPVYSNTFVGALDEKFDLLTETEGEKIVIVSGSSSVFGIDSEIIEKYTGMPVVNFGLYAALGTKVMLDLSRAGIGEGDIVIISPELDSQTMSMYFNSQTTLQAIDDNPKMLKHIDTAHYFSLLSSLFEHTGSKLKYMREGVPNPEGAYNANNFNKYGDLEYERNKNVMPLYYDSNKEIVLDESIIDYEFIEYLNDYISYCESVGASVYFAYCPMNSIAIKDGLTDSDISDFDALLRKNINCDFIGYIDDYILAPGYFYDSNFHLNDTGSRYRTLKLTNDLLLAIDSPTLVKEELPEAPMLESGMIEVHEKIVGAEYFEYARLDSGNYMITGLTELGKTQSELVIPLGVEIEGLGYAAAITIIGEGAFDGGNVERIVIPENSYVAQMNNGAFLGASHLRELYIYKFNAEAINPPANFVGAADGFEIHAPKDSDYLTGYFWSQLSDVRIILDLE